MTAPTKGTSGIAEDGFDVDLQTRPERERHRFVPLHPQWRFDGDRVDHDRAESSDEPQAIADSFVIAEDATVQTLDVLANDTDIDGGPKEVTAVGSATKGTPSVSPGNDAVRYLPEADANGTDSFTYTLNGGSVATVTVTITASNDPPVAEPNSLNIPANAAAVDVHALANDRDVDGDTLTISAKTNPSKGQVVIGGGGATITYQPFHNLFGPDSFTYTVSDGHGGTAIGTVSVTITSGNHAPNAVNDSLHVPQGAGPRQLTILANDQDVDGNNLTIKAKTNGAHGTVVITGGGTGLTYNPVNSYHGIDTFTYTISDGLLADTATVLVTVDRDRTAPVVVAPTERFPGHTVGSSTTKARLTWSARDPGSGVKRYKLQVSVDGGGWKTISLPKATTKSIDPTLKTGHTYRFRVRAMDGMGNVSAYVKGPLLKVVRYSEASGMLEYVGVWARSTTTKALGGATRHAASSAKRATFVFTGYDIGWIATTATSSGKARDLHRRRPGRDDRPRPQEDGVPQAGLRPPLRHARGPRTGDPAGRRRAGRHRRLRRPAVVGGAPGQRPRPGPLTHLAEPVLDRPAGPSHLRWWSLPISLGQARPMGDSCTSDSVYSPCCSPCSSRRWRCPARRSRRPRSPMTTRAWGASAETSSVAAIRSRRTIGSTVTSWIGTLSLADVLSSRTTLTLMAMR